MNFVFSFSSFDVAIKQAKSVDSEAQDELLREAEKLSKLRDHPNVVNIKVFFRNCLFNIHA